MCRVIDQVGEYKILQTTHDYVVVNTEKQYANHAHFKSRKDINYLLKLIKSGIKPRSNYMKKAAKRLLGDDYDSLNERGKRYTNHHNQLHKYVRVR